MSDQPRGPAVRLSREDLELGLAEMISKLSDLKERAEIRIVGGAAIALWHNAERGATVDIDAILIPSDTIVRVAKAVARERSWDYGWLNDKARIFLPSGMGQRGEEWLTVYARGDVTVQVASLDMLIAMKLNAALRRGRREIEDLQVLLAERGVTSVEDAEEIFEAFYPGDAFNERCVQVVAAALAHPVKARVEPPRFS